MPDAPVPDGPAPGAPVPGAPAPPAPDDPAQLGPFLLRGRWGSSEIGTTYQGLAPDGRAVTVVALGPGPSRDAASRDRFAAAVSRLARQHPGAVLGADPGGTWPWAALPAAPGRPAGTAVVQDLLASVTPAVGVGSVARGPSFAPHWTGERRRLPPLPSPAAQAPFPAAASDPRQGRRTLAVVLAALGALLLVLVLAWWGVSRDAQPAADPFATPAPRTGTPPPTTAPPTTPPPASDPPTSPPPASGPSASGPGSGPPSGGGQAGPGAGPGAGPTGPLQRGPGVAGPSFGARDQTREMRLEGLSFPFRVPATWGCLRSDTAAPPVRWVCLDDRWIAENRPGNPPGGVVQVQPCPAPCGEGEWQDLRTEHAPDAAWQLVDVGTVVQEDLDPASGGYRIRMSRVFASTPGGPLDTHVFVRMTAPPGFEDDVRKVVNDIRANTP